MPLHKFPDTKLRNLQFDSFFIECVRNVSEHKQENLEENEFHWIYSSDTFLHRFCEKATFDTKCAILAKLGFHFATTVYSDRGCDMEEWLKIIQTAKGSRTDEKFWDDPFTHESQIFVEASFEVRRMLTRIDILTHSKMFPISRYIKRLRDYKKLAQYEQLYREQDFVYFILKICFGYTKLASIEGTKGVTQKQMMMLLLLYFEHRPMTKKEIHMQMVDVFRETSVQKSLDLLRGKGLIQRMGERHYTFSIADEGLDLIKNICLKLLQFV